MTKHGVLDWVDYDQLAQAADTVGWVDDALCVGEDPALWFPRGTSRSNYDDGVAICHRCPSLYPCLAAHLGENYGCYGATIPVDRARIRRRLAQENAA